MSTIALELSGDKVLGDDTTATTVDEWKAYLASNPVTIVYELATPQEIDLGPASDLPNLPSPSMSM